MPHSDESYANLATEYAHHIRESSPAAADCLKQIQTRYGAHAAYLAGFALIMLKDRLNQVGFLSLDHALKSFTYYNEMENNAEAIQLYLDAGHRLLEANQTS